MLKIYNGTERIWILNHACVISRPGEKARVKHISRFARRWRLAEAKNRGNKIEPATPLERKLIYITFGAELRAVGGIR